MKHITRPISLVKHNFWRKYWWTPRYLQTVERIQYAPHPTSPPTCDINSVFSCTNGFDAWQSAVFGFSNSIMCLAFFAVTLGVGFAGATAQIGKVLRLTMHFFALFFLGFGAW